MSLAQLQPQLVSSILIYIIFLTIPYLLASLRLSHISYFQEGQILPNMLFICPGLTSIFRSPHKQKKHYVMSTFFLVPIYVYWYPFGKNLPFMRLERFQAINDWRDPITLQKFLIYKTWTPWVLKHHWKIQLNRATPLKIPFNFPC